MEARRPDDERAPQDVSAESEKPELFALTREAGGYKLSRRGFLKAAGAAGSVGGIAATATSCARPTLKPQSNDAAGTAAIPGGLFDTAKPQGNLMLLGGTAAATMPRAHADGVVNRFLRGVLSLAMASDGKLLASGGADNMLKLWSLPEGKLLATLEGHKEGVWALTMGADGKLLASGGGDNTIKLRSLPDGKLVSTLEGHRDKVLALAMCQDGRLLASGSLDHTIKLWSLPDGKLLTTLEGHRHCVPGLAMSLDGKLLASGSADQTIKLWALPEGRLLASMESHKARVSALAMSSDGRLLASGSEDRTIKRWSLPEGGLLNTLEGHTASVRALAMSPDGSLLASGSADETIKLWRMPVSRFRLRWVPGGRSRTTLEGHRHGVEALAMKPDGKLLASGDWGGTIILWQLEGERRRWALFDPAAVQEQAKLSRYQNTTRTLTGIVCTCDLVCACNTVWVPAGAAQPAGAVCVCNAVTVGAIQPGGEGRSERSRNVIGSACVCDQVCTCDTICTCNTVSTPAPAPPSGYSPGGHYWYPN